MFARAFARIIRRRFPCQAKAKCKSTDMKSVSHSCQAASMRSRVLVIYSLWLASSVWHWERLGGWGGNYINPKQINVWQFLKGCGKWLQIEPTFESPNLRLWWFLLESETENTDLISNWSSTGRLWFSLSRLVSVFSLFVALLLPLILLPFSSPLLSACLLLSPLLIFPSHF